MNREIKFRAWDKKDRHMLYEGNNPINGGDIYTSKCMLFMMGSAAELMQFTGLKDKHGKEIYEGDIMDYGHNRVFYISYVGCQFVATFSERVVNTMIPIQNFEIIGNIHEHPHLIAQ